MKQEIGLNLFVQIQLVGKRISVTPNGDEPIQMQALGMPGIGMAGITINKDGDPKVQGDEHLPLCVGDPGEVAELLAQSGRGLEKAAVLVGNSEVFINGGLVGYRAGLSPNEMDEHATGLNQFSELQDGIGLRLREVGLMNDMELASGESFTQTQAGFPEIGGGAGEENAEGITRHGSPE